MANSNRAAAAARAAQMRAEEARKDKQRKQVIAAVVAVVVVLIAVAVGVVIANQPAKTTASSTSTAFVSKMTSVPAASFDKAGTPTTPGAVPEKLAGGTVMMDGSKPKVVYVGAEYCPYCAGERWAIVAALSRFGTFTGLEPTRSAVNDGNVPTVTFLKSSYSSQYVSFQPYETQDRDHKPLQQLPADIESLFAKYNPGGGIPWTYYGTHATGGSGVPIDGFASFTGNDAWDKIAAEMQSGTGTVGQSIDANANMIAAQVCQLTKGQPSTVCTSAGVVASTALLAK